MMKDNRRLMTIGLVGISLFIGLGLVFWWRGRGLKPALPVLAPPEITPWVTQPREEPTYNWEAPAAEVKKLPVYRYEFPTGEARARAVSWARALGFAGEPKEIESPWRGKLYTWTAGGKTLVVDQAAANLSYSVDLLADPQTLSGSYLPTFAEAAAVVERMLLDFGPVSPWLKFVPQKSRALEAGVARVSETALDQADLVEVHLTATINGYPLYQASGPGDDLVVAWIGKDSRLLRLDYSPLGEVGEKIGDYPLKNEEELQRDLDEGGGVVVSSDFESGEDIVSVAVIKTNLGYLLPEPGAGIIQPIFVISGQAQTASGESGNVKVYLPATRVPFLK